jgi:hypothetical protein
MFAPITVRWCGFDQRRVGAGSEGKQGPVSASDWQQHNEERQEKVCKLNDDRCCNAAWITSV